MICQIDSHPRLPLSEAASQVSKEHSGQSQTKGLSNSQHPVVKMEWPSTNSKQTLKLGKFSNTKKPEKHIKFSGNITATSEIVEDIRNSPTNTKIVSGSVRFSHPHIIITWAEIWNMRLFFGKKTACLRKMEISSAQPHQTGEKTNGSVVRSDFNWTFECKLNVSYLTQPKDPEIEDWTLLFLYTINILL